MKKIIILLRYLQEEWNNAGADPGFSFRGGGGKRLCARMHIRSAKPNSLLARVQGPLKGPGNSRVILMLSRSGGTRI